MGWEFYVAQALGLLTTVCVVVAKQLKNMRYILLCEMLANLLCAVSSFLLGGLSGAWICAVATIQVGMLFALDKKGIQKKTRILLSCLFAAVYIIGTATVYTSWRDLISCGGAMLFLIAIGQSRPSRYRICMCTQAAFWTAYYLSILSFGSMVTNVVSLASAVLGIIRLDLKKKSPQRETPPLDL